MEEEVKTAPVQREYSKEEVSSFVMKDLETIISFANLIRMNPHIFNALAEVVYERTKAEQDGGE